jgi:hypothetical protein
MTQLTPEEIKAYTIKTQAQCQAALIPPPFQGGQCLVNYDFTFNLSIAKTS